MSNEKAARVKALIRREIRLTYYGQTMNFLGVTVCTVVAFLTWSAWWALILAGMATIQAVNFNKWFDVRDEWKRALVRVPVWSEPS